MQVVPTIYCQKCSGIFDIPHDCNNPAVKSDIREPNARPLPSVTFDEMSDSEVEALRQKIAERDARKAVRLELRTTLVGMFDTQEGENVRNILTQNMWLSDEDLIPMLAEAIKGKKNASEN